LEEDSDAAAGVKGAAVPPGNVPVLPDKGDIEELRRHLAMLIDSNERLAVMYRRLLFSLSLRISLIRGIVVGFGWVLGTTIVVTTVLFFMRPFLSVPYIGEAVKQLVEYVEHSR
jgi:hypothetical protein